MIEQESPAKFLPAFFVDVVQLGEEFASGELPEHMTWFPPIYTEFTPKIAEDMRRLINQITPFTAVVGEEAFLGENHDIPVRLIESTPRLLAVRRALVSTLQHLPHSRKFEDNFTAHITGSRFHTGDHIKMGGLSIVEKTNYRPTWQVISKIGLKGGLE